MDGQTSKIAGTSYLAKMYLDNFTATVKEEPILFIVDAAQIVDGIVGERLQIECDLCYNHCRAHQFFKRILRYHLHVGVASSVNFQRQRSVVTGRNAIVWMERESENKRVECTLNHFILQMVAV